MLQVIQTTVEYTELQILKQVLLVIVEDIQEEIKEEENLLNLVSKFSLQDLDEVLHLLKISGSIDYCRTLVNEHLNSAIREINYIEENPAKKLVLELAHYVRSRYD